MSQNGKGDKQRPTQIDRDKFEENWDRIFRRPEPKPEPREEG